MKPTCPEDCEGDGGEDGTMDGCGSGSLTDGSRPDAAHYSDVEEFSEVDGSDKEEWQAAAEQAGAPEQTLPYRAADGQVHDHGPAATILGRIKPMHEDRGFEYTQLSVYCRVHQRSKAPC